MSARIRPPALLRLLLLVLLVGGIVAGPVLALDCELRDMQPSTVLDPSDGGSEEPAPTEDCCAVSDCSNCCSHTVALQPLFDQARSVRVASVVLCSHASAFEPIAVPVALRPPIAA